MLSALLSIVATDTCDKSGDFFGLRPWYHYLPSSDFSGCDLNNFTFLPSSTQASDVPLVMLAVIDDLLRIAGIVAVSFVVVGAVRYITSQGNPEQTAQAQSTVINALIGTAIAVAAATFVGFVGSQLGGG
jgi:hypothetical protein